MPDELRAGLAGLLPRLRRFGIALTGSSSDADELVQNACERVLRRSGQLRDQTRMDAWIYGIMRNLWIDEIRHRRVRRHDELTAAAGVIGDEGEANAESRLTLGLVRRVLGDMPADHRTILVLVCVDGLSYREVSEVLDIPIGTVMSRLSRARAELHERLAKPAATASVTPFPLQPGRSRAQSA